MQVFLLRHGEAVSEGEDAARPLSRQGNLDIGALAGLLGEHVSFFPGRVYHSPKLRASQTAALVAGVLPGRPILEVADGLAPMDDPGIWYERLERMDRDTMLVGHLPHLSRLASLLLLSDGGRDIVNFTPGTLVCLEKSGRWRIKWMISPQVLRPGGDEK